MQVTRHHDSGLKGKRLHGVLAVSVQKEECENVCGSFFLEGSQNYNGYRLVIDETNNKEYKDFDDILFRCRIVPDPTKVLGNSPISTKSIRVKARYNYTVEEAVKADIQETPEEKSGEVHIGPPTELSGEIVDSNKVKKMKAIATKYLKE